MPLLSRGILIAIEGIDGSGKSTLAKNLALALETQNFPVLLTQEPGKTDLGKLIKPIVQENKLFLGSKAEYLLFAADRAQHFHEIVLPALKNKQLVISDRMADSSLVYQGFGRGLDLAMIDTINSWAMEKTAPDLVIYTKISPELAQQRVKNRGQALSSFESERADFIKKLSKGFDSILLNRPNVIIIDASKNHDELTRDATTALINWIQTNTLYA